MWWWMHGAPAGDWWWMMLIGWGFMLLYWGAIIALITWAVRQFTTRREPNRSLLDIARERYARGEITQEQYEELRRTLPS
jgi:putative membrane protein